jgi:L,D-transpeptidase YcbB
MIRKIFFTGICALTCVIFACADNNQNKKKEFQVIADTTIGPENEFNPLHLDSLAIENFVQTEKLSAAARQQLFEFYIPRNYQYAWFAQTKLNEQALNFYHLQSNFMVYNNDSSFFNPGLAALVDSLQNDSSFQIATAARPHTELAFTAQFFRFASRAFEGSSKINTTDLGWYIPRKKINLVNTLEQMISGKIDSTQVITQPQYVKLREHLIKYYEIEKNGGWKPIQTQAKKLSKGDIDPAVKQIRDRLYKTGDLAVLDTSNRFDETLEVGVQSFQERYGLKKTGIVTPALIAEMNTPIHQRIEQILVNMERMRWAPVMGNQDYLFVNIPAYKLYVYEKGKLQFNMNVVVGKAVHQTVIFTGTLKHVVMAPYWNVPPSITRNEVVPAMRRDKNYLSRNNMEITGYSGGIPVVRQKPGPKNSLGLVKFLFPNSYNIYLHDTPSKSLFSNETRAFSHGCIRVSEPKKLAVYLLRDQPEWTSDAIETAMNGSKEKWVNTRTPTPVAIGYFTAWVSEDGKLHFRDDIYGHDKRLREQLFVKK